MLFVTSGEKLGETEKNKKEEKCMVWWPQSEIIQEIIWSAPKQN